MFSLLLFHRCLIVHIAYLLNSPMTPSFIVFLLIALSKRCNLYQLNIFMELTYCFPLFRHKFIYLFDREHIDHTTQSNTRMLFCFPEYIKHKVMIYSPSMITTSWKIHVPYHPYKDSPSQVSPENIDASYGSQLAHLLLVKKHHALFQV